MVTTLQVRLLGEFSVTHDKMPVASISMGRLQLLIAYLILHRDTPRSRQQIAFEFWPDSTEAQARTNLRQLVHNLRRALPAAECYVQVDGGRLHWKADAPATVDLFEFERVVQRADEAERQGDDRARISTLEEAAALYRGDLLPGHYDDWLLSERDRLRDRYTAVLEQLVRLHEDQRDYLAAIRHAKALLSHNPLREASYCDLMRLHSLNNDRTGALRVYQTCVTLLRRELGIEPGQAIKATYQRLVQTEAPRSIEVGDGVPESTTPLFGRGEQWGQLLAAWRTAASRRPRLVLITGEAGIGKTRLAEELYFWTKRQGYVTARARSYQAEGRLAYGPVTDWLRSPGVRPALSRLEPDWRTEVARLLPELFAEHPDLPHPEPLQEGWQRQNLFAALARAVVGAEQPLLLLIDDLQWSDQDTLEWLHYLLRFDPDARLLVLGTLRGEEVGSRDPLQRLIHELRREDLLTELRLEPLDAEATAQLARHLSEDEVNADVANQLNQLYRDTEGNPLFIVETVRAGGVVWLEEDQSVLGSTAFPSVPSGMDTLLPPRVHAVISARLAQLSPAAQDLAGLVATAGRAFDPALVIEASDGDEVEVADALDELWQRQIIRDQADGLFDFSHDKIREVAYVEVSPARRALLHRRVARALEHVHIDNLSPISSQLAAHYERAGMPDEAIRYYERAAEAAQRVYAHTEAINLLRRGLAALMRLPESPLRDARELELQTAHISSLNALKTFDAPETGEIYGMEIDQVALRVQEVSQRLSVPPDPRVLRARAIVLITRGQPQLALELGEQLLDIARNAGDDPVLNTEAHYVIGVATDWLGQLMVARRHFEAALRFYDRQRHRIHTVQYGLDPGVACQCRLAYTLLHLGYPEQAAQLSTQSLSFARELSHPLSLTYSTNQTVWVAVELGNLERGKALVAAEIKRSAERLGGMWRTIFDSILGWIRVRQEQNSGGITLIRRGISDRYASGQLLHIPFQLMLLADAYRYLNTPEEGLAAVAKGLALVEQTEVRFNEAELYRLKGELLRLQDVDVAGAEAAFHQALDIARAQEARLLELRAATALARLLRDQGRGAEGRRTLQAVYDWFTEGFDTPDLREARELLTELQE